MFWDDEMYNKVVSNYPVTREAVRLMIKEILHSALDLILKEGVRSDKQILNSIIRTDSRWRVLAKRLIKDGYPLIAEEGFKSFAKKDPLMKDVIKILKW